MKLERVLGSRPIRIGLRHSPFVASHYMRAVRILRNERTNTGGSISARYCYSVWLRHLFVLSQEVPNYHPQSVIRMGPATL